MNLSKREKLMSAATVFVIAFGIVGTQARKQFEIITAKSRAIEELSERIVIQRELISSAQDWAERYEQVRNQMPVFRPGEQVDTYWLNIMDIAAEQHDVKIRNRNAKEETVLSDVYEFPIEVRDWEATLEALLKFMHAMQSDGAMLDIRELRVSPVQNRQGFLKGSFILYCAYMRGTPIETQASVAVSPTLPQPTDPPPHSTDTSTPLPTATTQELAE